MIYKREKTSGVSPIIVPAYLLEKVSRFWCQEGKPTALNSFPELRRWSQESGEVKVARVHREEYQREQSSGYLLRVPLKSSACLYRNYLTPEKEPSKRTRKNILENCTGLVSIPNIQSSKAYFTRRQVRSAITVELNQPQTNVVLVPFNIAQK